MNYTGGKGEPGVYQNIINQIPPHEIYIEGFLGGGAILRHKQPARINIGIDLDPELIEIWQENLEYRFHREDGNAFHFFCESFFDFISQIDLSFYGPSIKTFIYLDPPYLMETRKSQQKLYNFELETADHEKLLEIITSRSEMIMISGYKSDLYCDYLSHWRSLSFLAMTRSGKQAREWLWMNYPQPNRLHDYNFLGKDFTDRQRIKRKAARFRDKILRMDPLERAAILAAIDDIGNFQNDE